MPTPQDHELVKRVMRDFNSQKLHGTAHRIMRLGCGHHVEITKPKDQYIECPADGRKFLYIHSRVGNQRMYSDG